MSRKGRKVRKAKKQDRIAPHEARALQQEANRMLSSICRVTTNLKDEVSRTAFINVRTMEAYTWTRWPHYHTLMVSYPYYWKSYAVVRVDGWEGVTSKHYDLTPKQDDGRGGLRKEKYLLSSINTALDVRGQELLDNERKDKLLGYGTIVYSGPLEITEEMRDQIVEVCREQGMTLTDIELAKALGGL